MNRRDGQHRGQLGKVDIEAIADWTRLNRFARNAYYRHLNALENGHEEGGEKVTCHAKGCLSSTRSSTRLCSKHRREFLKRNAG